MDQKQANTLERLGVQRPKNPNAVSDHERFVVTMELPNGERRAIQSEATGEKAWRSAGILQEYSNSKGFVCDYSVVDLEGEKP